MNVCKDDASILIIYTGGTIFTRIIIRKNITFCQPQENTNHRLSFYRSGNRSKQYNKMKKVCYRIGVFPSILVLSTK